MRKVIAAINLTLDGVVDHTAGIPDEELHDHYTAALYEGGVLLYGRITYQLMEDYWPMLAKDPSGERAMDEFAASIDRIPKIVFSRTLKELHWDTATLATDSLEATVRTLKAQPGKPILIGSRSLICALMNLDLIDEYQFCIHPVVAGKGDPLFKGIADRKVFKLLKTKTFGSGATVMYYAPLTATEA